MIRLSFAFFTVCCIFICGSTYASALDLARELHIELNSIDRETMPSQFAVQFALMRPELRSKEQELKRLVLDVLDSKEYENIRAEYFAKAFSEQELKEQLALARSPAFKMHQKKMTEIVRNSGTALLDLVQNAVMRSADALSAAGSTRPAGQSLEPPKITADKSGRVTNYRAEGSLESVQAVGCIALSDAKNTFTPPDLYKGVGECIAQANYDRAVGLFALAGIYARFDAERITDKSAGQAKTVLIMNTFSSLAQDKKTKFDESMGRVMKNTESLNKLCGDVQRIGMPNYYPRYMILHGIKAFTGNPHDGALVKEFDSSKIWKGLQSAYLKCPTES